ncbi:serine hydrolase domain-containing protein [Micromonospora sp. NPDC005203]|uniref:serine hydrolase domain-containing protein n=1 Tax=Micromonospora sp. NPDC005203 TaxID=3364226 RepID=UPI0036AC9BA2
MIRQLWTVVVSVGSLVATLAVAPVPARAGQPGSERQAMAAALDQLVADGFPGAVAYGRVDGRRWQVAAGVADRATGARARPDDRFRIASNTKAFVSTVLLQLVGEGRLTLDDPVERWLPRVVRGNGNDGSTITVRQLLNHTSGLWDPTGERSFWAPYLDDHDWDRVIAPRTVIALAVAHRPDFAPGASWGYSNTNYLLAGLIIEAVTGRDAASEVRRRIIGPLGLRHTSFPITDPEIHGRHLHGYDLGGRDVTTFSPSYDWTAGAMISTAADLARFHRALFGGRLLGPAQQRALETLVATDDGPDGYGLGVQRMTVPCAEGPTSVWTTDGGGPGFTSMAATSLDNSRQFVLAGNVYDIDADVRGLPPVPASAGALAALRSVFCATD